MNGQARGLLERPVVLPRPPAPWVAVSGGKGGVGKTLIAVNLALGLRRLGHKTLLVDFDPGLGNIDVHLRLSAPFDLEHLADGACEPWQAVVDGPGRLRVVLGRSGSPRLSSGDVAFLQRALDAVAVAAHGCDVVVCDTGAGIGPAVLEVCRRARMTLGVTTPDPAAITDAYALGKVLRRHDLPLPYLVVNQAKSSAQASRIAERLGHATERFLASPLPHLASLRSDPGLAASVLHQRPFATQGEGEAADALRALAVATATMLGLERVRADTAPAGSASRSPGPALPIDDVS